MLWPDDESDYRDRAAYKVYVASVRRVLENADRPLSIGDIRRIQGNAFCDRYIHDALESLELIEVSVLPTRWVISRKRR